MFNENDNNDPDTLDFSSIAEPIKQPKNDFDGLIDKYSQENGVDSNFVRAVIGQESGGKPNAKSWAGYKGLMQVGDGLVKKYAGQNADPYNPEDSIKAGTKHLAYLQNKYKGDHKRVLVAYNAGEKWADRPDWYEKSAFLSNDPAVQKGLKPRGQADKTNTQNYVNKIYNNYLSLGGGNLDFSSIAEPVPQTEAPTFTPPPMGSTEAKAAALTADKAVIPDGTAPTLPKGVAMTPPVQPNPLAIEPPPIAPTVVQTVPFTDPTLDQFEEIPLDRQPATYPAAQTISDINPAAVVEPAPAGVPQNLEAEYKTYSDYVKSQNQTPMPFDKFQAVTQATPDLQATATAQIQTPNVTTPAASPSAVSQDSPRPSGDAGLQSAKTFAPASADSYSREIIGNQAFAKTYKTKPTADQVIADLLRQNYGITDESNAEKVYKSIKGTELIQPADLAALQADIDQYWNPNTGEYATPAEMNPIYKEVRDVVEAYNSGGESAVRKLLAKPTDAEAGMSRSQRLTRTNDELRALAESNISASPFSGGTKDDIEAEYQRLKGIEMSEDEAQEYATAGRNLKENQFGGGSPDVAVGLYRGLGGISSLIAGAARPFASLGLIEDAAYQEMSKIGQGATIFANAAQRDDILGTAGNFAGQTAIEIPKYIAMSALPGGAVAAFGLDAGLQSAGRGETLKDVGKEAVKGAILGGIFHGAGKLSQLAEKKALNTLLSPNDAKAVEAGFLNSNFNSPVAKAALVSKVFGTGTRIGTIGAGVFTVEKAAGATNEQAFESAVMMTLFDVAMQGRKLGEIKDLAGKIFRVSRNGRTADVTVEPNGDVKLLKGNVPDKVVEAEFNADKVIDVELKDGVYQAKGDASAARTKETRTTKAELGEAPAPKALPEDVPRRIDKPIREAVQKAKLDTRAQKIVEALKDGEPKSLEQLQKSTRYNQNNLVESIETLFSARNIEILSDNTIRLIKDLPADKKLNLYEKFADRKAPIELGKSSAEGEINLLNETQAPVVQQKSSQMGKNEILPTESPKSDIPPPEIKTSSLGELDTKFKAREAERIAQEKAELAAKTAKVITKPVESALPKTTVFTERGTKAEVAPKVVDVKDLITSLDDGYPAEFQPRDRSRTASKAQISEITNKLNPELLGDSPKASDGRPLVVPVEINGQTKYAVISGNGRTAAIREAYSAGNEGSKKYAEFARAKETTRADKPVYVGILNPEEVKNLADYAKEANESAVAQMSATEQAKVDAERLDSDTLNLFVPAEDGSIHAAANRDFIRSFMDKNVSQADRNRLMDASGNLNQDGVNRVRNAIFAKAFADSDAGLAALQKIAESTDNNVKRITNALLQTAGKFTELKQAVKDGARYDGLDITSDIAKATQKFSFLREEGTPVETYLQQQGLFGEDLSPFQKYVLQTFDKNAKSGKAISGILNNFILAANEIGDPKQANLFGDKKKIDAASIYHAAVLEYEAGNYDRSEQQSIFDIAEGSESGRATGGDSSAIDSEGAQEKREKLTASARAALRRSKDAAPKDLKAQGIKPLGETGKFGHISHYARQNGFALDADVYKLVTGEELDLPESADYAQKQAASNAVLDAIAEQSGKNRSSQMSPLDWRKWLEANAANLPDSAIDKAFDAITSYQDWHKKRTAFTKDSELVKIINEIDLDSMKEFRDLPLKARKEILALGRKYEITDQTIKQAFNDSFSAYSAGTTDKGENRPDESAAQGEETAGDQGRDVADKWAGQEGFLAFSRDDLKWLVTRLYEGRGENATPKKEVIVNFRRAGLLTGFRTHLRNIVSNGINQASEEAIRPLAVAADITASAVTGKRTVQAPSLTGIAKSFAALVRADESFKALNKQSAIKKAWSILKNGDIQELEKNQLQEMKSGSPILDAFVNYTFRALGAEDALFKTYAFRRSLEEQAKTRAITESREKISKYNSLGDRSKWIAERRNELLSDPPPEMVLEAELFADFTTFTNNNRISDWFKKIKDANATGKTVLELLVPYDKTPTNIVLLTLEYTPLGFIRAGQHLRDLKKGESYTFDRIRQEYMEKYDTEDLKESDIRKKIDEKFGQNIAKLNENIKAAQTPAERQKWRDEKNRHKANYEILKGKRKLEDGFKAADRQEVEDALKGVFSRLEQNMFAKSFARAGMGSALLMLGMYLAAKGLLSGYLDAGDREESKEFYKRRDQGILNGSLKLGDRRYQINDTPSGKVMVIGANIWESSQKKKKAKESDAEKVLRDTKDIGENIIFEQPLLNSLSDYFGSNKPLNKRVGGLLGSFVPTIFADIADVKDPEARANDGILDPAINRIPILRESQKKAKNPREKDLRTTEGRIVDKLDPFKSRKVQK